MASITREHVANWWHGLDTSTERTNHKAYQLLHNMFEEAIYEGLLEKNPCQLKGASKPSNHRDIKPLTPEQVAVIADAMPVGWGLIVKLGAWCALRSGEILELRRKDIDFDECIIRITRQVFAAPDGSRVVGAPKTNAGVRSVHIPETLKDSIKAGLRTAQLGADGLLFYQLNGKQLARQTLSRVFQQACAKAGVSGYHFHDLRHTGLTYLAAMGATVKELQAVAGHTTSSVAMRYQHVAGEHLAGVLAKFDTEIVARAQ
jgi:integrase